MKILSGSVHLTTNHPEVSQQASRLSDASLALIDGLLERYAEQESVAVTDIEIVTFQTVPILSGVGATVGLIVFLGIKLAQA